MANLYNQNPIRIDTPMPSGWKSLQTLNTGFLPPTIQNPGPIRAQFGIRVSKIIWKNPGASASFSIINPIDSIVLLDDTTPGSFVSQSIEYDFAEDFATWRDFQVSVISAGLLEIRYRA